MRVERRGLAAALPTLARVAGAKGTIALVGDRDLLSVSASDGTVTLTCHLPGEGAPLAVSVPARLLARIVKNTPGHVVDIDDQGIAVDGVRVKLPDVTAAPSVTPRPWALVADWPAAELHRALAYVAPAMSDDATRSSLCQLVMDGDRALATDGHRLHLARLPGTLPERLQVPAPAARLLARLLRGAPAARIAVHDHDVRFQLGPWLLQTACCQERFPDVDQVIPDVQPTHLRVITQVLVQGLDHLLPVGEHLHLHVNGHLRLRVPEVALVDVPTLHSDHVGPDLLVGLDGGYLRQALAVDDETVGLGFGDAASPVRVEAGVCQAVIMPLRT